ncbi:MAG TPA: NAD(P)/FAD-dependent oxidoreductase [Solirubrobacterales bacterium]|nr:NAD(P)/FAD-dependent oxidoreductase [Solirubrobacterales bacterium]
MPRRQTKRGGERTPLSGSYDVIVCGASFAGLTVARQLAGSGGRVLVLDRYEIGERQTSACGIPTEWLEAMGLQESARQEFRELVLHTPRGTSRYELPWTFSTFDYRELCELLWAQCDAEFETAKVNGRTGETVHTDRGDVFAPLIVDALGWRRILASDGGYQPPDAPLSRGLEVHPHGGDSDLEVWIDRRYVPAGYGWSFPARDEQRIGVGSFDPGFHVKDTTVLLAEDLERDAVRYQGNWIPHKIRKGTEDGIFFVGDSAGHCLPLTAEGIRTAFYFGIKLGDELRAVVEGREDRETALRIYGEFVDRHEWKFRWLLRAQKLLPKLPAGAQRAVIRACGRKRFVDWAFGHYLRIAPPDFAEGSGSRLRDQDAATSGRPAQVAAGSALRS